MPTDDKTDNKKPEDKSVDDRGAAEQAEKLKEAATPKIDETLDKVIDKINDADSILVTLSKDPSVDEMAAALGLTLMLDRYGKHTTAIYSGKTPNALEFLKPSDTFESNTNSLQDFIIALDKEKADHLRYKIEGDFVKVYITPYKTTITEKDLEFSRGEVNVDLVIALNVIEIEDLDAALAMHGRIMHNAGLINVSNEAPGRLGGVEWSNPLASSVSEMIVVLLETMKQEITKDIATALLTGIVAATERFSNNRTTPDTLALASKLMQLGADQQLIVAQMMSAKANEETTAETPSEDEFDEEPMAAPVVTAPVAEAPVTEAPVAPETAETVTPETATSIAETPVVTEAPEVVAPAPVALETAAPEDVASVVNAITSGTAAAASGVVTPELTPELTPEQQLEQMIKGSSPEQGAQSSIMKELEEESEKPETKVEVNIQPDDKNLEVATVPQSKVKPDTIYGTDLERTALQDKTINPLEEKPKDYAAMMDEMLGPVPDNNPAVIATPAVQPVPEVPAVPTAPVVSPMPVAPNVPNAPVAPATPVAPLSPLSPTMPTGSVMPEAQAMPSAPTMPTGSVMPEVQAMPSAPTMPTGSVMPETLAMNAPTTQTNPVMAAVPAAPVAPTEPVTPVTQFGAVDMNAINGIPAMQNLTMPQGPTLPQVQTVPELPTPPAPDVSNMMPPTAVPPVAPMPQGVPSSPDGQLINPIPMPVDESEAQLTMNAPTGVQVQAEPVNPVVVQPDQEPASVPPVSDPGAFKIPGM